MTIATTTPHIEASDAPRHSARGGEVRTGLRHLYRQYAELAKIRLNAMVLITAGVGFIMANPRDIHWPGLLITLLGTGLAAVGAAAFNQLLEISRDGRMQRTRARPLPSGQMSRTHALAFAILTTDLGIAILWVFVNPLTAVLGLANVLIYLLAYTPLKSRTSLNTLVGAICGALPPMMGWAAASGRLGAGAWLLGAVLFIWQIPHFLALAWLYREDYARGGYRMLPVIDPAGRLTCLLITLYSLALLPLAVVISLVGVAGWIFAIGALILGAGWLLMTLHLSRTKTRTSARRVFLASVTYLPLVLILMVFDARTPPPVMPPGAPASTPLISLAR